MKKPYTLAYLDTNILLMIIKYVEFPDYDYKQSILKRMYDHRIKIPQIVLGEALAVMLNSKSDPRRILQCMTDMGNISNKLKLDSDKFPPPNNRIIQRAKILSDLSDVVNNMDSLILAHAIENGDATHFLTTDGPLKNSRVLSHIEGLKKDGTRSQILNIPAEFTIGED